ncbi:MAG: APH(3'') family aminoglycoside O-phosphotransferase [Parvibaculaceae bacterium]
MTGRPFPESVVSGNWTPVVSGESGDRVYRRADGGAYAKIAAGPRAALLEGERHRIAWLSDRGIAAPRVLDWTASDGESCLVMSVLPGVPASTLPVADLERAWSSIAACLRELHKLPTADCPFDRGLARMFAWAEDVVSRAAVNPDFLDPADRNVPSRQLLDALRPTLARRLVQESADRVVCHGDACLPNFMVDPDTLRCTGMIDLGRLGAADPYADLSLLLANARESWSSPEQTRDARERLFACHGIDVPDEGRLDFYLRLDPLTWG